MIKKDSPYVYILVALIGATILTITYHFSLQNKYKLCSLIPTIPIMGLLGLYFITTLNKENKENYIVNHIRFLLITCSLYISMLFFLYLNLNLITSFIFSLILWFSLVYYNLD